LRFIERGLEHSDLVGPLDLGLGVGELSVGLLDPCLGRGDRGLLLRALQREDGIALSDVVALLDAERLHAPALLGADQHHVCLHVARELILLVGRQREQSDGNCDRAEPRDDEPGSLLHRAPPGAFLGATPGALIASSTRSICALRNALVSRWWWRSNRLRQ